MAGLGIMRTSPRITVLFLLVATFLFHLTACLPGHMRVEGGEEPGTLLLNMLTKNEALNLDRSLPKWAPIIDYWIIGIDDKNTDNSEAIIRKHLGHIPGQTVSQSTPSICAFAACLHTHT